MKRISLTLIFLTIFAVTVSAQDDSRAAATWQVQKYDLNASLPRDPADRNITSKASLTLKNISGAPASTLSLRINPAAEVLSVSVNGATADFSKREEKISANSALQRIVVRIPSVPAGGSVTAAVDYKLAVKENTGLAAISPVASQFLPLSYWYPTPNSWYFPRGADYAPFHLQVTGPAGQSVLSSGEASGSGFEQKLTGQPFFIAGTWDPVTSGDVTVYIPKGSGAEAQKRAGEIAQLAAAAKTFMSQYFGTAPAVPVRVIAANRGAGFTGGGTILVDDSVFLRPKFDAQTAMSVYEGVARLWLGGAIDIRGDGQGTLREGLVRYIATQALESSFGADVADVERLRQRSGYSVVARRDAPLSTVSPLDEFYYSTVANKGAMAWRLLEKRVGTNDFRAAVASNSKDGELELSELRAAFAAQKPLVDYLFDGITDMDLMAGLPQVTGDTTKVALRNTGTFDATVNVSARTADGEVVAAPATIRAGSFGEINFKPRAKIVRVEIDSEKLYPQTDYSNDIAPRESAESDVLLNVKRAFDKQDFAGAEKAARQVLSNWPRYDDVRVLLARSLAALGRSAEAEKEFRAVLAEKLPTARSIAWADLGIGELAQKAGQTAQALAAAQDAIRADGEYGATLGAFNLREKLNTAQSGDDDIKAFFAQFDKAVTANRKADIDSMITPGDAVKFANGLAGQTEQWQSQVRQIDKLDENTALVDTQLSIKLLNRDPESGLAVFRLSRVGGVWKLSGVEIFEVR